MGFNIDIAVRKCKFRTLPKSQTQERDVPKGQDLIINVRWYQESS